MYEMEQIDERVILVGIDTGNEDAANRSLDELSELAKTAKADVVGGVTDRVVIGAEYGGNLF